VDKKSQPVPKRATETGERSRRHAHAVSNPADLDNCRSAFAGAVKSSGKLAYHTYIEYTPRMAITKGAKKAHRQSLRKKRFNDARKSAMRNTIKVARTAPKGDVKTLAAAYKAIDKALKSKLIKKNTAARRKAKVAKLLATK